VTGYRDLASREDLLELLERWNTALRRHHAQPLLTLGEADSLPVPALRRAVGATSDRLVEVLRAVSET
jgi:hypothetical protein